MRRVISIEESIARLALVSLIALEEIGAVHEHLHQLIITDGASEYLLRDHLAEIDTALSERLHWTEKALEAAVYAQKHGN